MFCGLLLTLFPPADFAGMLLFSAGFFAAHSVPAAGLARARVARGQASSLYLFSYYLAPASPGRSACSGITTAGTAWAGLSR
jgi:YNFM family putative membrane transporter